MCGGTEERDREKSQCKLSSEREGAKETRHLKSRSVTSFMRKECKARSTLGLPMWQESEKQVKGMECPQSFNLQDCATQKCAIIIKLAENLVNIVRPVKFHQGKSMDPDSSTQALRSGYVNCPDN